MLGFFKKKKKLVLKSPVVGKSIDITEVPDEVFSTKMVGDGIALIPSEGKLYSPVDGKIVNVFPTKHAIGMETQGGIEILIHIGIDTVGMKGEGFTSHIEENQKVNAGDLLMTFDIDLIEEKAQSSIIPVVITNMEKVKSMQCYKEEVDINSTIMEVEIS
ncbi:PTS sugar transporter subunit IIA [Maledivibacter halophilus]|uniref:PTS system IIA component, Glc family n=1 Tax=Maledivibacter halophilus TaxID=36842 RepID=A0A1T5M528_9FIRM|nr:PTS glucose transporter subunit IIA [Maledivibacter halophilus]SKC82969.1 PTS system IIA component, Glc family [Maledivibacter halophilus]